jgi:hypothetical protein
MRFKWHCRECNEMGQENISLQDLRKFDSKESNILKIMLEFVRQKIHNKGCKGDIGIKSL